MEHSDISRRNMLRSSALGVGALGSMSMVSAAAAAPAFPAEALVSGSVDIFLKIEGVPGESLDSKHKDEIEVLAFSWGVTRPASPQFAKPTLQDFSFITNVSKASPLLMLGSAKGTHFKTALLTVRTAGHVAAEFYKVTLQDCLVTSYQTSASSEAPTESISLHFTRVTFSYAAQKPDGSVDTPIEVTYP